jgi:protein-disulfide isomerase/uncharacterized membrane protein
MSVGRSVGQIGTQRLARLTAVLLAAAFAGLFAAAVLSISHILNLPAPCGTSRGCEAIARHPLAVIAGIPIALIGVAAYLGLIPLIILAPASRIARRTLLCGSLLATTTSLWLLAYAHVAIAATCWWCVGSAMALLVIFLGTSIVMRIPATSPPVSFHRLMTFALITSAAIGLEAGWMKRAARQPPLDAAILAHFTPQELVDPAKTLGPETAPLTIILFADLWCPACRAVHGSLVDFQKKSPNGIRLAFRHLPLWELRGHEASGAAAALSEIAAEQGKFWGFADRIYARTRSPDREGYLKLLTELGIDAEAAEKRIADPADKSVTNVQRDRDLAESLGVTSTPTFVLLLKGERPVSANALTLPGLLNSLPVQSALLEATMKASQEPTD